VEKGKEKVKRQRTYHAKLFLLTKQGPAKQDGGQAATVKTTLKSDEKNEYNHDANLSRRL
jgi:hypothetical protein